MTGFGLVVHHRYTEGATDLSGYGNHGHRLPSGPGNTGGAAVADGFAFDGLHSRVVVFPAPSLQELGGVRVRARVRVDRLGDRRTIVEGYLAFVLSVEPDGALAGGIYSGDQWHSMVSSPATVPLGRWIDVAFTFDGRDTASLSMDGVVLASRCAPLGPIGSIEWPFGLNVGAWPDQDLRVLDGRIAELWVWRSRR